MPSENDHPQFISYRSISDHYEVHFTGGPLDGARICTDIFPQSPVFTHRVHDRPYSYNYRQTGPRQFQANFAGFPAASPGTRPRLSFVWRIIVAGVMLLFAAGLTAGVWRFLNSLLD